MATPRDEPTDAQLHRLCDLVYRTAGIDLDDKKRELIRARLGKRMRARGLQSLGEYLELVESDDSGDELTGLLDALATNFTSFFREEKHFELLRDVILPPIFAQGHTAQIWSAACSSGEEPYSIAMEAMETRERLGGTGGVAIFATDLSTKILAKATAATYPFETSERSVGKARLKRFFQRGVGASDGFVRVRPDIARLVTLQRFNLLSDPLPAAEFDVIFLRNVLIYFDRPTQEAVVRRLATRLRPGGWFLVGHSESLAGMNLPLQAVRPASYRQKGH